MIWRRDDHDGYPILVKQRPTLLASYWVTGLCLTIILLRLGGRMVRTGKLFREDKIMAASMLPLLARMALVHIVLIFGTNNLGTVGITDIDVNNTQRIVIGSKMVLASRVCYAGYLWIQKLTISEFFHRLTSQFWKRGYEYGLYAIRWFLLFSFIGVFIATIGECHPFPHYWQITPDPGSSCRQAYGQLITMGSFNIITDLILIVFPVSIILTSNFANMRKFQLTLLFCLSIFPICATAYRVPKIIDLEGRQQFRTLWASIEILAATAAANAIVIGSFIRDRGPKKAKFKFGSQTGSLERPPTTRRRPSYWGSDEDLVRGTGLGLEPELRYTNMSDEPRPAPMAIPMAEAAKGGTHNALAAKPARWRLSNSGSDDGDSSDTDLKAPAADHSRDESSITTPTKLSFFDVGGLLEAGSPRRNSSIAGTTLASNNGEGLHSSTSTQSFGGSSIGRHGSSALLQDIGGLLSPVIEPPRKPSLTPKPQPEKSEANPKSPSSSPRLPSQLTSFTRSSKMRNTAAPSSSAGESSSSSKSATDPPEKALHKTQATKPSAPISRSDTLQSLQDVGGLLSSTNEEDYASTSISRS